MSRSLCLWNPAYSLETQERVDNALAATQKYAAGIQASVQVDPDVHLVGGPGVWLPENQRISAFLAALNHDVIIASRGGYGCVDLLSSIPTNHNLPYLVGYSDVTALHAAWRVNGAPESLYGFMPGVPHGQRAVQSAIDMTNGLGCELTTSSYPEVVPLRKGDVSGTLFVACLRVLAGLIGTAWMPNLSGSIIALEDIDERPYCVDRAFWQLHASGALHGVVGLVTNGFPTPYPTGYAGPSMQDIIAKWADRLAVPAIMQVPFGHHADPVALPCGRTSHLSVRDSSWSLSISERYS